MAKLRKSYSNYIIRKKRQLTSKGSVYERDWMTVSELDGFAPGTVPVYASGNFKMTINADRNGKKKYSFSNWILNDSGTTEWDLTMIREDSLKVKSELIKPNYSSILDFVCYGSAIQLVYGSINDIYEKYPAELYGTGRKLKYFIGSTTAETSGYYVENPFGIDVHSSYVKQEKVVNPLRYMMLSWYKYEFFFDSDSATTYDIRGWFPGNVYNDYCINGDVIFDDVKIVIEKCEGGEKPVRPENKTGRLIDSDTLEIPLGNDSEHYVPRLQTVNYDVHEYNFDVGDAGWIGLERIPEPKPEECFTITFTAIYINGKVYLLSDQSGWHLRLKKKYIDESFDLLDDFEKVLLNRNTKPKYKAKFYTPRETESGVITSEKSYIWPVLSGGWNLDMETEAYESYLDSLLYLATFYDESRSDNIWRSYTHESIKNFDWTTPRETYVPEMDGHLIDTERMEAILKVCGRQFDDLKRYIENIKFTVNVSYDCKNNMPDSVLAKFLEMNGWDVKNVSPVDDNLVEVIDDYPGMIVKNTPEEANNEFMRRMILNSRNILSKKGTRAGIEAMYSMFGIFDVRYGYKDDSGHAIGFEMDEYNVFTNNYIFDTDDPNDMPYSTIVSMNQQKNNYGTSTANDYYVNDFKGLMCDHKIDIDEVHYLVPWYDSDEIYDAYPYYQMMGGWGKRHRKRISVPELSSGTTELFSIETGITFEIYDETVKNVKVADSFKTLNTTPIEVFHEQDVYYVVNMEEAYSVYGCDSSSGNTNYVIYFGRGTGMDLPAQFVPYNDEYAWYIVPESDFNVPESEMKWWAKKILYMESIHDNSIGNNPHNGNNMYDGGKEFFEFYKKLFKGALENDMFSLYKVRINQENSRRHYENRFRAQKFPDLNDDTAGLGNIGFDLTDLQKDNEKIWYFLSYDNGIYAGAYDSEDMPFPGLGVANPLHKREFGTNVYELVTNSDFPLKTESKDDLWNAPIWDGGEKIVFDEATLDIPEPVQEYYDKDYQPDETSSYSVINTKNLKITYHLPWELEDYVTDVVEFYVKQLIPSTVIVEFVWDYTDGTRPTEKIPYAAINLSPAYQRIRSYSGSAEIEMGSVNVEDVGIEEENTTER